MATGVLESILVPASRMISLRGTMTAITAMMEGTAQHRRASKQSRKVARNVVFGRTAPSGPRRRPIEAARGYVANGLKREFGYQAATRKVEYNEQVMHTFEHDTKRSFPNFLSNTIVTSNNSIRRGRLRRMGRRRCDDMGRGHGGL